MENESRPYSKISSFKIALVALALALPAIIVLVRNLALGFVLLTTVAIVAIILQFFIDHKYCNQPSTKKQRRWARISILVVGGLALVTMNSYFYPRSTKVYSNSDHHALAIEGLETRSNRLLLAADSREALFDSRNIVGSLSLEDTNTADSTATLAIDGAGIPVFHCPTTTNTRNLYSSVRRIIGLNTVNYYELIDGQDNLHYFGPNESLELIGPGGRSVATMRIEYERRKTKWYKAKEWSARYLLDYTSSNGTLRTDTSTHTAVICKYYPLSVLFPSVGIIGGVDLSKIELVRSRVPIDNDTKPSESKDFPFIVAHSSGSGLTALRSGGRLTPIGPGASARINLPLDGRRLAIGLHREMPQIQLEADSTGSLHIRFAMPQYRYLGSKSLDDDDRAGMAFMVASTLVDENGDINSQHAENILLYEMFDHTDNIYQMSPVYLYFNPDLSRTPLKVNFMDADGATTATACAGDPIPRIPTIGSEANWIASLDNFKDATQQRPKGVKGPLPARKMMGWMTAFILMALLMMSINDKYGSEGDGSSGGPKKFTYIEPIVYLALIVLLAIRMTLMWRVSVFPPVMGINLSEFNSWRTASGMMHGVLGLPFFIVVTMVVLFVYKLSAPFRSRSAEDKTDYPFDIEDNNGKRTRYYLKSNNPIFERRVDIVNGTCRIRQLWHLLVPLNDQRKRRKLLLFYAMWIPVILLSWLASHPLFHIGLPVLYYFVVDHIIHRWMGSRFSDKRNNSYAYFWHSLVNNIIAGVTVIVGDGGYGIIFIVFSVLTVSLRLIDLYGHNPYNNKNKDNSGIRLWGVLLLASVAIASLCLLRPAISTIYTNNGLAIVYAVLLAAGIAALMAWTMGGFAKRGYLRTSIIAICFVSVLAGAAVFLMPKVGGEHTAKRVAIMAAETPESVLGKASSRWDMQKFLEASLNDWVLEEYRERGHEIHALVGERGTGYFKLQPHSKVGASWMTQLTDLSVSRFLIAEQSTALPVLLILIFLLLTFFSLLLPADRRWARSIIVQIPLLLTLQSLLVWMAVTRRFFFIGQDFPMISLISTANTVMCFIGFTVWVIVAMSERFNLGLESRKGNDECTKLLMRIERRNDGSNTVYGFIVNFGMLEFLFLGLACLLIVFSHQKNRYDDNTYDVAECVKETYHLIADEKMNSVENLFRTYQDSLERSHNRPDITQLGSHADIVRQFCDAMHYIPGDSTSASPISEIFSSNKEYGRFAQATFDYYLEKQLEENDINNMVYVVKRRYNDSTDNKKEHVRYAFDITIRYFRQKLPTRLDNTWRGSVIAYTPTGDTLPCRYTARGTRVYTLPETWTREHGLVVRPSRQGLSVMGRYAPRQLEVGEAYNLTRGEVLQGTNAPDLTRYGSGNYLAQNVIINSRSEFIYPLQKRLYWANPLAVQMQGFFNHKLRNESDKGKRKYLLTQPVHLTLSASMTNDIYRAIDGNRAVGSVAVVVADGDGYVRALVDHDSIQYTINPNDARRIQQVEDSLKREGMLNRGHVAERFFGNKAILCLVNGPGSSQKPIVWSAVTTQYPDWDWNTLKLACINNDLVETDGDNYKFYRWAGDWVADPRFRSIKSDEGNGVTDVDVQAYMRQSSNLYNGIMVHLGSFTRHELENSTAVLSPSSAEWTTYPKSQHYQEAYNNSVFPLIIHNGRYYTFARPLDVAHAQSQDGMLHSGLRNNFGLSTDVILEDTVSEIRFHPALGTKERIGYYAYPQASYFNVPRRASNPTTDGVKMTAIGHNGVWLVSPLKMAEMFGKIVSFNRNYSLTINGESTKLPFAALRVDGDDRDYLAMRNAQFITGLSEVFTGGGTANRVYQQIRANLGNYHIYGKTGTINGEVDGREQDDHLLAVVITDRDIQQLQSPDDFAQLRFYVIYIADFNYKHVWNWYDNDANIINAVLQSTEFQQYMQGGNR